MEKFSAKLIEASRELTARDKIRFKNFGTALSLDTLVHDESEAFVIEPIGYVAYDVHNDNSENKDYKMFIIEDKSGALYRTGSGAFFDRFKEIFDTMAADAPGEEYTISVVKRPSAKYKGKFVLLCQLN